MQAAQVSYLVPKRTDTYKTGRSVTLIIPHSSLLGATGLFVFAHFHWVDKLDTVHTETQTSLQKDKKKKRRPPPHSWLSGLFLRAHRWSNAAAACSHAAHYLCHAILGQPRFASSEYLWMLLSGHIPLTGRLPGMGLPVLSPCSRPSGSFALHPTAVCISPRLLPSVLLVLWRKMRGKELVVSRQVLKKIYTRQRLMFFSRVQSLN